MIFYFGGWPRHGGERDFDGSVAMFAASSHSCLRRLAGLDRAGSHPWTIRDVRGESPRPWLRRWPPTIASQMAPTSLTTWWTENGCLASAHELEKTHE